MSAPEEQVTATPATETDRRQVHIHPNDKNLTVDEQLHVYDEIPDEIATKAIADVRAWLETNEDYKNEENQWLRDRFPDLQLMRFARARSFKLEDIKTMITEYIEWVKRVRPDQIRFKDIAVQAETGKVSARGSDRFGRKVLVLHNEFENSDDYQKMIQHMIYNLEKAVREMNTAEPYGASRYVVVLNMSNFSYSSQPPMSVAKEIAYALSTAYPERLGNVFIFNAPWLFRAFYTALTVVLDSRTKSKIHFVKDHEYKEKLPFFLGDNWEKLTGLNQEQVGPKIAPGFQPDEWKAICLADDLARFGPEEEVVEKKEGEEVATPEGLTSPSLVIVEKKDGEEVATPEGLTSPSLVIVDPADCQSPSAEKK